MRLLFRYRSLYYLLASTCQFDSFSHMDSWSPIFSRIVDSSLWSEYDFVVKVFLTMLAKKDRDNVVRGSAYNISQWAKKTEAETLEALRILAAPDTRRLEPQPHEGRRIERVDGGWLILNGKYYQDLMREVSERVRKAKWAREHRTSKRLSGEAANQRLANNGASQSELDRQSDSCLPENGDGPA